MKVRDIMTQPPETCRLDTDLRTAIRHMRETGCGSLAVMDRHGKLAGILTDRDLAMALGDTNRNAWHVLAHEAMTKHVRTCSPDDDLHEALKEMASAKVRRLPVVTADGDLEGVLSIDDVILWGAGQGGVTPAEVLTALRAVVAARADVELEPSEA
jgi:CBS domain-containing protein